MRPPASCTPATTCRQPSICSAEKIPGACMMPALSGAIAVHSVTIKPADARCV